MLALLLLPSELRMREDIVTSLELRFPNQWSQGRSKIWEEIFFHLMVTLVLGRTNPIVKQLKIKF